MKKYIIQIEQTIFVAIFIIIGLLQNNGIIGINKNFMNICVFSILICSIGLLIVHSILIVKHKEKEKIIAINLFLMVIELIFLGVFCGSIDNRLDKIKFSKICGETEATIYNIEKKERVYYETDSDGNRRERKEIKYVYYFEYEAMSESNNSTFTRGSNNNYIIGDKIKVYYDKENIEDYRLTLSYASNKVIYIILMIICCLRIIGIFVTKKYINY